MQYFYFITAFYLLSNIVVAVPRSFHLPDAIDLLAAKGLINLAVYQAKTHSKCTVKNAVKRREW